ncbi:hypothetical protein D3C80_612710 [compost metagenome]
MYPAALFVGLSIRKCPAVVKPPTCKPKPESASGTATPARVTLADEMSAGSVVEVSQLYSSLSRLAPLPAKAPIEACSPVSALPWLASVLPWLVTVLLSVCSAEASALVATCAKALAAAAAASVAALSVTATQVEPVQRLGVFAPPVVSIQRFCARRLSAAGAVVP